jgi:hypothetical protein
MSFFASKNFKNLLKNLSFFLSVGQNYVMCRSKLDTFSSSVGQNYVMCRSKLDTFSPLPVENFIKKCPKTVGVGQNYAKV